MYEGIIDALMKLFALMITHCKSHANINNAKESVKAYLESRYSVQLSLKYFLKFDEYYELFSSELEDQKKSNYSDSFLSTCIWVNNEFNYDIKVNLLFNLLKFSLRDKDAIEYEMDFLNELSQELKIDNTTYDNLKAFIVYGVEKVEDQSLVRIVKGNKENLIEGIKYLVNPEQLVEIQFLWLPKPNLLLVRYHGKRNMYINGHKMKQNSAYIFPPGAMVKTSRIHPVYQSDIMASYIQKEGQARIVYTAKDVEYKFNRKQVGLHRFNFRETSGHFVGILGGSGVGKTTLLNVLNGNLKPSSGQIAINGNDIHEESEELKGIIGYVPQDDLLIEELTVYQNLHYNAKLCFGDMSDAEIEEKVEASLVDFDLVEARDLVVGNPLQKVLSGGQRKRLNIALELMREPRILLADEPTSGLSAMDTEKVVSLLKRHCIRGGLVIANIHQPASDIYKQFDRVIVMDKGGYVVYSGNPLDAIEYFKTEAHYVNPDVTNCETCGNVKAEQPLKILEQRTVSPTGRFTRQRKVSPQRWFERYAEKIEPKIKNDIKNKRHHEEIPKNAFKTPRRFEQFKTFFARDIKAKLTNKQFMLIAALEAPILALLFSLFAKTKIDGVYSFAQNDNLPSYLFMSVFVALFIGMSISAETIFKDRLILKREAFLNLSKSAYLSAKISIAFLISAIQMLVYVLIANSILEIQGMTFYFWITLFSTACFANILALNLSAGLKSIVSIYILIPLLLIPQLLFSGVIVDFKSMNSNNHPAYTPWIGDVMASRWAYEAIAVEQYKNNDYHKPVFDNKLERESISFDLYYRIPELESIIYTIESKISQDQSPKEGFYQLLAHEMSTLAPELDFSWIKASMTPVELGQVKTHLTQIKNKLQEEYQLADIQLKNIQDKRDKAVNLKGDFINNKLDETLTGRYYQKRLDYYNNQIIQLDNPVHHVTPHKWGRSHFYAPYKMVLGKRIEVLGYNLAIIWLMILILAVLLYTDLLRRLQIYIENLNKARRKQLEHLREDYSFMLLKKK